MVGVAAASKFGDAVATGATSIVGEGGAVGVGAETGVLTGEAIAVADEESEGAVVRLVDGRRVAEAVPAVGATLSQANFLASPADLQRPRRARIHRCESE